MDTLLNDVRLALRALRKGRNSTTIALLCLALGVGANAAIFSVVYAVLLRPLPYPNPERLVRVFERYGDGGETSAVAYPNVRDLRAQSRLFDHFVAYRVEDRNLQGMTEPERVVTVDATDNMFAMLGTRPLLGRFFVAGDDRAGHPRIVVLSEAFWRTRLGADPAAVGRTINLDGEAHSVIGVAPREFRFPVTAAADLWLPLTPPPRLVDDRWSHWLNVVGRMRAGTTLAAANAELATIMARLEQQYPESNARRGARAFDLHDSIVAGVKPALLILLGAVAFVLLIACANVANLLLARSAARRRDFAVRTALGATSSRLVRQLLTESVVLAVAGALAGALVARASLAALTGLAANTLPNGTQVQIDGTVFLYLLLVALVTGIGFGVVPALHAGRGDLRGDLSDAAKGSAGVSHKRFRSGLVIAEVAFSVLLLVGAGLLVRAFVAVRGTAPGLASENVLTMHLSLAGAGYMGGTPPRVIRPTLARIRAIPGVRSAGATSLLPLQSWGWNGGFTIEGQPAPAPGEMPDAEYRVVSPGYFRTLGIRVMRGRDLTESDGTAGARVVMINEALARRHFPNEDPIGRRLVRDTAFTIVGVVSDVRQAGLERQPLPEMYFCPSTVILFPTIAWSPANRRCQSP